VQNFWKKKIHKSKTLLKKQTTTTASRGVKEKERETYNNKETKERDQKDKKMQMKGKGKEEESKGREATHHIVILKHYHLRYMFCTNTNACSD
jgi:hypothetical protein